MKALMSDEVQLVADGGGKVRQADVGSAIYVMRAVTSERGVASCMHGGPRKSPLHDSERPAHTYASASWDSKNIACPKTVILAKRGDDGLEDSGTLVRCH
jgi:hypothetical protein